MAPAGRRRRAAGPSTRRYQEPQTFTLPLHPARMHEAVAAADSGTLHEVVGSEYVTKYLERIGAKPTRANAELVRKHLPLSDDNVKASFKARGALSDELTVTLPKFQGGESRAAVSKAGSRARANQVLLFGMLTRATEDGNEGDREDDAAAVGGLAAGPSVGGAAAVGAAPMTSPKGGLESERRRGFQELSKKYVFPFRLEAEEKAAAAKGKARQSELARTRGSISMMGNREDDGAASTSASAPARGAQGRRRPRPRPSDHEDAQNAEEERDLATREEVVLELAQSFEVDEDIIYQLQSDFEASLVEWKESLSTETTNGRLTDADLKRTISELSAEHTVPLFLTFTSFLYEAHVATGRTNTPDQQECMFVILEDYAVMKAQYKQRRASLFFTLPIVLLSLRVLVSSLFTSRFPMWCATVDGERALKAMDDAITSIFDPHHFHSEISLLQSSSAALKILQRHRNARWGRVHSRHLHDMSPLTRIVMGEPTAAAARRVAETMVDPDDGGRAPTLSRAQRLTHEQRSALFDITTAVPRAGAERLPFGAEYGFGDRSGWINVESYTGSVGQ